MCIGGDIDVKGLKESILKFPGSEVYKEHGCICLFFGAVMYH